MSWLNESKQKDKDDDDDEEEDWLLELGAKITFVAPNEIHVQL